MVKGWLSLLAFAGGLYFGREVKAKEVEVPPNVVFVPPRIDLQFDKEPFEPEKVVKQLLVERGLQLSEENVKRLSQELEKKIKEVDPNLEKLIKIYRKQVYFEMLEKIATAFCDGRIDRTAYLFLIKRYVEKIVKLEF
jgi:hypothetical protein